MNWQGRRNVRVVLPGDGKWCGCQVIDFLTFSETWFNTDTPVSIMNDIAPAPGCSLHALWSVAGRLVAVVCLLSSAALSDSPSSTGRQVLSVDVRIAACSCRRRPFVHAVFNIYRPQRSTFVASFLDELGSSSRRSLLRALTTLSSSVISTHGRITHWRWAGRSVRVVWRNSSTLLPKATICSTSVDFATITMEFWSTVWSSTDRHQFVSQCLKQNVRYQSQNLKAVDPNSFECALRSLCSFALRLPLMASLNSSNASSPKFTHHG